MRGLNLSMLVLEIEGGDEPEERKVRFHISHWRDVSVVSWCVWRNLYLDSILKYVDFVEFTRSNAYVHLIMS